MMEQTIMEKTMMAMERRTETMMTWRQRGEVHNCWRRDTVYRPLTHDQAPASLSPRDRDEDSN